MIVRGHIKDNQILIDENIQLPDGTQVEIRVPDEAVTQGFRVVRYLAGFLEKPKKLSRK